MMRVIVGQKYNWQKAKVLVVLKYYEDNIKPFSGLSAADIHKATGVSYSFLRKRLQYWHSWGLIKRRAVSTPNSGPVYVYRIAKKGAMQCETISARAMAAIVNEVNNWRGNNG